MPRCPPGQHAAQLRRGARALRPEPPSCKPHPAHRPRPRPRCWSVRNRGRHAPTAQHHRLLGLALQAHRRPCHGNRSETAVEGRVRVQRGQLVQTCTIVVLIVLNLAPPDLSEASMGCVRVRGWLRCLASPGKLVARLFRSVPWPGPGWAGERTGWGHRWGKGSFLAACAPEHNGYPFGYVPTATDYPSERKVGNLLPACDCL